MSDCILSKSFSEAHRLKADSIGIPILSNGKARGAISTERVIYKAVSAAFTVRASPPSEIMITAFNDLELKALTRVLNSDAYMFAMCRSVVRRKSASPLAFSNAWFN